MTQALALGVRLNQMEQYQRDNVRLKAKCQLLTLVTNNCEMSLTLSSMGTIVFLPSHLFFLRVSLRLVGGHGPILSQKGTSSEGCHPYVLQILPQLSQEVLSQPPQCP